MRVYKLHATVTASAVDNATVVIQQSGRIKFINWMMTLDAPADNDQLIVELSFAPVNNTVANNPTGPIDSIGCCTNGTAVSHNGVNASRMVDCPVAPGDTLRLNSNETGAVTGYVSCYIWVDEGPLSRRR